MLLPIIFKYLTFIVTISSSLATFNINTIAEHTIHRHTIHRHTIHIHTIDNNFANKLPITMSYHPLKGYDEKLTIIPSFQATVIINNWISYLSQPKDININNDNDIDNDIDNDYDNHYDIPKFIVKSVYDMKSFIAINKMEKNTIIFAWCPDITSSKKNIVYIIVGKIVNNELQIYRIAQNPYYYDILYINSKAVVSDIKNLVKYAPNVSIITYDKLHEYDNRYLLSWTTYESF